MFLVLILSLWLADSAAFTIVGFIGVQSTCYNPQSITTPTTSTQLRMGILQFDEPEPTVIRSKSKSKSKRNDSIQKDMDQKVVFPVGTLVKVTAKNIKAFSIPAKGCGSFSENGDFVPLPEDTGAGQKYLAVPVGLVGTVAKVIDTEQISANNPIQVQFESHEDYKQPGGYKLPVGFLFHFAPEELERIEG